MRFVKRNFFNRTTLTKKEIKKREKEKNENYEIFFLNMLYELSKIQEKLDYILFKEYKFFKSTTFNTNKINIITGNNGQGKSTLLNRLHIINCNGLESFDNRLNIGSCDIKTFKTFNKLLFFEEKNKTKEELSNIKGNLSLFTDFSTSFFKNKDNNVFREVNMSLIQSSHGTIKISAINDIFKLLKLILKADIEKIEKGLNIVVILDEPENGLSLEIQKEFRKKILFYISKFKKIEKISLTFFISSHNFLWKNEKNIDVYKINDLKLDSDRKKEFKNIFV